MKISKAFEDIFVGVPLTPGQLGMQLGQYSRMELWNGEFQDPGFNPGRMSLMMGYGETRRPITVFSSELALHPNFSFGHVMKDVRRMDICWPESGPTKLGEDFVTGRVVSPVNWYYKACRGSTDYESSHPQQHYLRFECGSNKGLTVWNRAPDVPPDQNRIRQLGGEHRLRSWEKEKLLGDKTLGNLAPKTSEAALRAYLDSTILFINPDDDCVLPPALKALLVNDPVLVTGLRVAVADILDTDNRVRSSGAATLQPEEIAALERAMATLGRIPGYDVLLRRTCRLLLSYYVAHEDYAKIREVAARLEKP